MRGWTNDSSQVARVWIGAARRSGEKEQRGVFEMLTRALESGAWFEIGLGGRFFLGHPISSRLGPPLEVAGRFKPQQRLVASLRPDVID